MVSDIDLSFESLLRVGKVLAPYVVRLKQLSLIKYVNYINFKIIILATLLH